MFMLILGSRSSLLLGRNTSTGTVDCGIEPGPDAREPTSGKYESGSRTGDELDVLALTCDGEGRDPGSIERFPGAPDESIASRALIEDGCCSVGVSEGLSILVNCEGVLAAVATYGVRTTVGAIVGESNTVGVYNGESSTVGAHDGLPL